MQKMFLGIKLKYLKYNLSKGWVDIFSTLYYYLLNLWKFFGLIRNNNQHMKSSIMIIFVKIQKFQKSWELLHELSFD